jgi:hypothetical protein
VKKPKSIDGWGRSKAKERYGYAEGGEVESPAEDAAPGEEPEPSDRSAEVDEFISRVMQDQIKKMED